MSRVITPPDTDFASKSPSILAINATPTDVEILTLYLKQLFTDIDVYLYRDEFEDTNWAFTVSGSVDKVFTCPDSSIQNIIEYLQGLNG